MFFLYYVRFITIASIRLEKSGNGKIREFDSNRFSMIPNF